MTEFGNLYRYIIDNITDHNPTIIYIGVGTVHTSDLNPIKSNVIDSNDIDSNPINYIDWENHNNQQFPQFLQDIKQKYYDNVKIILILIDPFFISEKEPYIVRMQNSFLNNSWERSNHYGLQPNHYVSTLGVEVVVINKFIRWSETSTISTHEEYNIEPFLSDLAKTISSDKCNSLLFYHEFTGENTILLENIVKEKIGEQFNGNKVCIDISRGADLSCYFNSTNPINYPVITIERQIIKYHNPDLLDDDKKKNILHQFKKFTKGFFDEKLSNDSGNLSTDSAYLSTDNYKDYEDIQKFSLSETNYLIFENDEKILCFQIIHSNLLTIKLISDGIISMIRQFYTMNNKECFGTKMYGVNYIKTIALKFNYLKDKKNQIIQNLELLDAINANKDDCVDYENIFKSIKNTILENLYDIVLTIYIKIFDNYGIDANLVNNLILKFKNLSNKYNITKINKDFINENIF